MHNYRRQTTDVDSLSSWRHYMEVASAELFNTDAEIDGIVGLRVAPETKQMCGNSAFV
jgi:hypothetical protein